MKFKSFTPLFLLLSLSLCYLPSFGQAQGPEQLALRFMESNKKELNLSSDDLNGARFRESYLSKHNGVTHVFYNQTFSGIDVYNAIFNANISADGKVFHYGNRFLRDLSSRVNTNSASITAADAVRAVQQQLVENANMQTPLVEKERNGNRFVFDQSDIALSDIVVELVYESMPDRSVKLAWYVFYYELSAQHAWQARVDATNGTLLAYNDGVISCNFGPSETCEDENHIHTPTLSASKEGFNFKSGNTVESYNAYPIPFESPFDGARQLLVNPAHPVASPFGWHDTDGSVGPEFTITRGNNAHAYQDIFATNASSGDEPDGGASLVFDFPLVNENNPYTFIDASVTNLFYWTNVIHDVWYQYGFDEAAGNFQENNYGNGGQGSDYVRSEALDGSGTFNANFFTPSDGGNGRMQMYIGSNDDLPEGGGSLAIEVTEPASIADVYPMAEADFGGPLPVFPIIRQVVIVDDGTGETSDACDPVINASALNGKIALVDRGTCAFDEKVLAAQNAGAVAVIVCNNVPGGTIEMQGGSVANQVTVPTGMLSQADCAIIRAQIPGTTAEFAYVLGLPPTPGPAGRDGSLDNGVIAHEYGHGISNRLTGGPIADGCLGNTEQMGEGWSDYIGMVMTIKAGDVAEQARPVGNYLFNQTPTGPGIRPRPYSTNFSVNNLTYEDVNSVAIPHGVGTIWSTMLWEMTWSLIDIYGFDPDMYNGTGGNNIAMQLVTDGMKLQACSPGFVDGRDAILAADSVLYGGAHGCLIWNAFAKRGLGFAADQGDNFSVDDGVVDFTLPSACAPPVMEVTKTATPTVDENGTITYTIEVFNSTFELLTNVVITDPLPFGTTYVDGSSSCANTSVSNDTLSIVFGNIGIGNSKSCTFEVDLTAVLNSLVLFEDDFESGDTDWTISAPTGASNWIINGDNTYDGSGAFFAANPAEASDQILELANSVTVDGTNPRLVFWHDYDTEANNDGGVVEISVDGGDWQDLGPFFIQNGYSSAVNENPDSPISGREAFNGTSDGYIRSVVDLSSFMNSPFKIRFRMATDNMVGGNGWYIDDVAIFNDFAEIINEACASSVLEENICASATTIVTFDPSTSTEEVIGQLGMNLFPNPTSGSTRLEIYDEFQGEANMQLFSLDGREIQLNMSRLSSKMYNLDLSQLPSGIYILEVITNTGVAAEKIVVR